ncbi:MAG: hypothetical protein ABSH38_13305 [Verrucomicrobiota bacterium]
MTGLADCQREFSLMLKRSKTKVIAPTLTLGLLQVHQATGKTKFSEAETQSAYADAVRYLKNFMGHSLHFGAKWEDAYSRRTLPKYRVLKPLDEGYELLAPYTLFARELIPWMESNIQKYIAGRLGEIPKLEDKKFRAQLAADRDAFLKLLEQNIEINPANFEYICFAVLRVHLEKFACKIYRDSRAAAHDKGVDISTNFGVVYQIKKLRVESQKTCNAIVSELQANFDRQRLEDGNVILVIDDIRQEFKEFLINMKIQSISKAELMKLGQQFDDEEDREKVLRIVYDEFRREYASVLK